jgi:peptidyl-dipeptidase Dcp
MKQNGGLTRANGDHFRDTLLSRGGSKDALVLFHDFTGRDPWIEPLLERRGLVATPKADDAAPPAEKSKKKGAK